jgi:hypothetical protein
MRLRFMLLNTTMGTTLAMVLGLSWPHPWSSEIGAQARTVTIPYRVACPACSIAIDTLAIVGGTRDGDRLSPGTWIARDSRGMIRAR